jgi:hypothetical protein
MRSSTTRRAIRRIIAVALVALTTAIAIGPTAAGAAAKRAQQLTISGSGTWMLRPFGDAVVNGSGEVSLRPNRPTLSRLPQ